MSSRPEIDVAVGVPFSVKAPSPSREYRRLSSLVLINGLAEQPETWFCNQRYWSQFFDVSAPGILVYDGDAIHRRIAAQQPISVAYLTDMLESYLDNFVQNPPYHLVASSLGGQIAVEYAVRHPERVDRLVLLCPSGVAPEEHLPVSEGARRNFHGLVASVFFDPRHVRPELVRYYQHQFSRKAWRKGAFRTIQDTRDNSIRDQLDQVQSPTLVICGREDQIVDPYHVRELTKGLPNYVLEMLPHCGHAPQIECADQVNRMVAQFLSGGRDY
jgi:pimeloyl-ACP methyl ester carboxylesterase